MIGGPECTRAEERLKRDGFVQSSEEKGYIFYCVQVPNRMLEGRTKLGVVQ